MKLLGVLVLLMIFALLIATGAYFYLRLSLPQLEGRIALEGVRQPVEIIRDRNAIPHIFAQDIADAHFALGFVHAQDRLWQMEINRRISAGRLAEVLGEKALATDKFMRTLGVQRHAAATFEKLNSESRSALVAYAAGVNAYLASTAGPLPPEFLVLGVKPGQWSAVDSLAWIKMMAWDLATDWRQELLRARLARTLSPALLDEFFASGIGNVFAATLSSATAAAELAALAPPSLPEGAGSNNWVIDGRFSVSGKPLLANDPHLSLTAPSTWYFAHLHAPGLNAIGATLPGVPAIVLGRNDRIAWGFTNTGPDVQDLYLEKTDAEGRYLTPDGWRAFETRSELIKVKDSVDIAFTIRESRHGPVISDLVPSLVEQDQVLAFAWTTLRDDDLTFQASVALARAGNWDEFVSALRDFHSPMQNIVYADVDGNIGFIAPGRVPIRKPDNQLRGLTPMPGWEARYDWDGFIPFDELPKSFNPASGKLFTANNKIVGDDYPYTIALDWASPYRLRRIETLLAANERHTVVSFATIQADSISAMVADFLPLLRAAPLADQRSQAALRLLENWNGEMAVDRPQPLIVAAWLRELSRLVYADELGAEFDGAWEQRPVFLYQVLTGTNGRARWCDDVTTTPKETCEDRISAALTLALADLERRYGRNMLKWRWGDAHRAHSSHRPFSRHPLLGYLFDLRVATPGDSYSINVGRYSIANQQAPYENHHAATLRAIYDLANLDRSLFIHSTGQSGNRLSPHYGDFADRWAAVDYVPMTTQRNEIEDGAIGTLVLEPRTANGK